MVDRRIRKDTKITVAFDEDELWIRRRLQGSVTSKIKTGVLALSVASLTTAFPSIRR